MSVRIIENWSDLVARVQDINSAENLVGFQAVELYVEESFEVEGYPNFLAKSIDTSIVVFFPDDCVKSLGISTGRMLSCRVRRADLNINFVHREHIVIQQ
jgi:hypothetical protein